MKDTMNLLKNRIKENFNKNKKILLVLLLIWIAVCVFSLNHYSTTLGKKSYGNIISDQVEELDSKTQIEELMPTVDKAESVAIKIATYARKNRGYIRIRVIGSSTKTTYVDKELDVNGLQDNGFAIIKLDQELDSSKDDYVSVLLTSDGIEGSSIGIYYSSTKEIQKSIFKINNETLDSDLTVRFLAKNNDLNSFYRTVIIYIVTAITLLILILLLIEPPYEVMFASAALLIGLAFCFVMTPLSIPDETAHYEYSLQISNFIFGEKDHLYIDSDYIDYGSYIGHNNVSSAYEKIVNRINTPLSLDNKKVQMPNDIRDTYFGGFIVQGIGVTIARLLHFNRIWTFYTGRIFNLLFYTACVYIAIKKTPAHKLLFGLLSIMPIFLQQAASYSYDCLVNGFSLIIIAYLLKFILVDEKISNKEIIFIALVCNILAPEKVVYGTYTLLYWLVPAKRYGSMKKKILCTLLIEVASIYQLLDIMVPIIVRAFQNLKELMSAHGFDRKIDQLSIDRVSPHKEGDEAITIGYILRNPWEIITLYFRTIRYNIKNWFYGALGRSLSGESLILPITLVHVMSAVPLIAAFSKEKYVEPILVKVLFVLCSIIVGLYIMFGFMISWTSTSQEVVEDFGGPIIQGIQGRYFSPLLPYVFTIFNNRRIGFSEKYNKYLIFAYFLIVFEVLVYILSFTFIN